jgi:hypothetical protein
MMKKILLILLCLPLIGFGQCPTIGLPNYYNCSDIAQFVIDYPSCKNLPRTLYLPYTSGGDLTNYPGLDQLDSISGRLVCDECDITSFAGLSNLKYISGDLKIDEPHNFELDNFYGLTSLNYIGGSLKLSEWSLESTSGLDNLNNVNKIEIYECNSLTTIIGFEQIDTLLEGLYIDDNFALSNLNGFSSLQYIGSDLEIRDNAQLQSLSGLINLKTVEGELEIGKNPILTSLSGLDSVIPNLIESLNIYQCDSLSYCALDNICEYIDQQYGISTIYDNNTNCNSILDISNDCNTLTNSNIENVIKIKNIVKIIDVLGRESEQLKNQPLFYIYDDGTVEKRIVIE